MLGWSIIARACRSASKRAMTCLRVHARLDDLEGDLAGGPAAVCSAMIDDAHAAFADLLQQLVGADHCPRTVFVRVDATVVVPFMTTSRTGPRHTNSTCCPAKMSVERDDARNRPAVETKAEQIVCGLTTAAWLLLPGAVSCHGAA